MARLIRLLPILIPLVTRVLRSPAVQERLRRGRGTGGTGTPRRR